MGLAGEVEAVERKDQSKAHDPKEVGVDEIELSQPREKSEGADQTCSRDRDEIAKNFFEFHKSGLGGYSQMSRKGIHTLGKSKIKSGQSSDIVGAQIHGHGGPSIRPIGMMIEFFGFEGAGGHEGKGFDKIAELEDPLNGISVSDPTGMASELCGDFVFREFLRHDEKEWAGMGGKAREGCGVEKCGLPL